MSLTAMPPPADSLACFASPDGAALRTVIVPPALLAALTFIRTRPLLRTSSAASWVLAALMVPRLVVPDRSAAIYVKVAIGTSSQCSQERRSLHWTNMLRGVPAGAGVPWGRTRALWRPRNR